jgi:SAM-dependent methyltransferase
MRRFTWVVVLFLSIPVIDDGYSQPLTAPAEDLYTRGDAERMIRSSEQTLAPVYAPLARQIIEDFGLAEKNGIGIDLGGGPGTLILELCKGTRMHWINADINPHFFPYFLNRAEKNGVGHRVSAIFADAHSLPFRDNFADVLVSRGCFFFWEDKPLAFSEIFRVLKPGGVAYVGRGMARDFPVDKAQAIREKQKDSSDLDYSPEQTANELRIALNEAGISDSNIEIARPPESSGIHYGVWVTIRKPSRISEMAAVGGGGSGDRLNLRRIFEVFCCDR